MHTTEHYGTSSPMATLYTELNRLTTQYERYLEQECIAGEVSSLVSWLNAYQNGSAEAGAFLQDNGLALIRHIKEKLCAAETELQRMDEESPVSKNFTGQNAHRLSRATALAIDAEKQLHAVLDEEITSGR